MDICYSTDNNYFKYMIVALTSAIYNNAKKSICFHVLCDGVDDNNKTVLKSLEKKFGNVKIKIYDIDRKLFEKFINVPTYPGITLPTYFRLYLPLIIKNVGKVLYLDGDTIINGQLDKLFDLDISDYMLAGVPDINANSFEEQHSKYLISPNHYINAGVVLMNLKRMREMHSERIVDDFMENHINDVKYGDQDIINLAFKDEIYILPNEYNVHGTNYFNRNTYKKPVIIHHVCKAWVFGKKTYYQSKYFKYLRKTDYKMQPRIKEFWWRIKTWLSVFWGNILHPSRVFNYEYMYGVYRWMFKRFAKKQK